ncbi:MAG TPA: formate--phosphoribosylaminoimidazolecarboxamide ligase [Methanofastidiosum sp.]|jgi:5-formaminoimidazole-4-carboxamide-1-(beta)-D-ribofuranosyl 5'-monophosphate synthetase|nr:formate--phosphoribosylaminoimidazolecarboxamide ligase [Methanofastidiosum sp.]HNZ87107.1 formate--phosphoribosylaminoimidazolecarboxamide ligase [Methanofastidiosum sp.]HOC77243.1 formate--phosphoribosylaminoimidazolecarboxamide ligase [Methanofastidiosum sp.]HOG73509.1 formate--phosphoribosylaminoimidazolecarboxamide ligase [Methanofastidiosum sp.]HPA48771.1 formate--phosphoribosylaminoimidazolecarboxamide ligase [Methanofastidiosum sp.]
MDVSNYTIATLGSHSALQILKGAKDEGFKTLCIAKKGSEKVYKSFGVADEIISVNQFSELFSLQDELVKRNTILIPHGSFIAYMKIDDFKDMKVMYFGNKDVLEWESARDLERQWLTEANIKIPRIFETPEEIDRPVIVKFYGAKGGMGYFLAKDTKDFYEKMTHHTNEKYVIQEYIIGVPAYFHYFYSLLTNELEIMSFDKRYESNVDSIGRISARDQFALKKIDPSYVVVGNIPITVRESLLPEIFDMGERVVEKSKELISKRGLFGPFCLEGVITPEADIYIFEISARIVAGTNLFAPYSPYTYIKYGEPMSTGRRIALEIKNAIKENMLSEIVC